MATPDLAPILHETFVLAARLAAPPLLATLAVGLVVSLLQAVTQINEATLAFVPKAIVLALVLALTGAGMVTALTDYTHRLLDRLVSIGGQ